MPQCYITVGVVASAYEYDWTTSVDSKRFLAKSGRKKSRRVFFFGRLGFHPQILCAPLTLIADGRRKLPTEGRKGPPSVPRMGSMLIGLAVRRALSNSSGVAQLRSASTSWGNTF